jgi:hypothetical protein
MIRSRHPLTWALVAVACLLIILGGVGAESQPSPDPGVTRFPVLDAPPGRLTEEVGYFRVPPDHLTPRVPAESALALAWGERAPGGADRATITFALFDHPDLAPSGAVPIWLVTYSGACLPSFGAFGHRTSGCTEGTWNVVLNADTGLFLQAYSS